MKNNIKKTILLVDDDALIAMAGAQTVSEFGYDVITAHSGKKAVEIAAGDRKIDLILMDIDLGAGMSGPEAAEIILKTKRLPIVFLTSHSEKSMVEKVRGITRYGYIIKNSGNFVLQSSIEMAFELFEANEGLLESEILYRELFKNMNSGVAVYEVRDNGRDFIFKDFNRAAERIDNDSRERLIGKSIFEARPGVEQFGLIEVFQRVWRTGKPAHHPVTMYSDKRLTGWYENFVFKLPSGQIVAVFDETTERKRTEEALRESEEKYRQLVETSPDAITLTGLNTAILACNRQAVMLYGYADPAEVIGKTMYDLFPPDVLPCLNKDMAAILKTGAARNVEYPIRRKDGSTFLAAINAALLRSSDGTPRAFIAITRDITEKKLAEETLRKFHLRQQTLLAAIPDIIMEVDRNKVYTWANSAGYEFFGEDVIGREAALYFEGEQDTYQKVAPLLNGDENIIYLESWQRRKDGEKRLLAWWCHVLKDSEGVPVGALSTARDITVHKQIEETLRESEERNRNLLDAVSSSSIGLFIVDKDYRVRYMNQFLKERFGEQTGVDCYKGIGKSDTPCGYCKLNDVINKGNIISYQPTAADGRTYDIIAIPYKDADGEVCKLEIIQDITGRKNAEEKIKALLAEKELILREVHHRMKNNMAVINNLLMLHSKTLESEEAVSALKDARSRIQSMAVLYDKLYRTDSFSEASVSGYLSGLVDEISVLFQERGNIKIEKKFDDFLLSSRVLFPLGIIVNELFTNAMKHAFSAGRGGTIQLSASKKGDTVTVAVRDNGTGVPESFDPDRQGGFGLKLVRILADQVDGSFRIERKDGTKFTVEFKV